MKLADLLLILQFVNFWALKLRKGSKSSPISLSSSCNQSEEDRQQQFRTPFTLAKIVGSGFDSISTYSRESNPICFSGPSSQQFLMKYNSIPQRVYVLAKPELDVLISLKQAVQYLCHKNITVYLDELIYNYLVGDFLSDYHDYITNESIMKSETVSHPSDQCREEVHDNNNNNMINTNMNIYQSSKEMTGYIPSDTHSSSSSSSTSTRTTHTAEELHEHHEELLHDMITCIYTLYEQEKIQLICNETLSLIDLIITFGGDGLLMHCNTLYECHQHISKSTSLVSIPPTMSFDFGSLGFLAPFKFDKFYQEIDKILTGPMLITLRMRLQCSIYRNNKVDQVFHVLNEAVIDRGPSSYLSAIDLECDSQYLTTVQGDGVIIATPTGSTAYSLAAGGSMVHPSVPAILLTPICAHTLSFRPIVLPDSSVLSCTVPLDSRSTAWVSFDGKFRQELDRGDRLEIRMSPIPFPTVNRKNFTGDWFDALRSGFMFNLRPKQKPFIPVPPPPPPCERKQKNNKNYNDNNSTNNGNNNQSGSSENHF